MIQTSGIGQILMPMTSRVCYKKYLINKILVLYVLYVQYSWPYIQITELGEKQNTVSDTGVVRIRVERRKRLTRGPAKRHALGRVFRHARV